MVCLFHNCSDLQYVCSLNWMKTMLDKLTYQIRTGQLPVFFQCLSTGSLSILDSLFPYSVLTKQRHFCLFLSSYCGCFFLLSKAPLYSPYCNCRPALEILFTYLSQRSHFLTVGTVWTVFSPLKSLGNSKIFGTQLTHNMYLLFINSQMKIRYSYFYWISGFHCM